MVHRAVTIRWIVIKEGQDTPYIQGICRRRAISETCMGMDRNISTLGGWFEESSQTEATRWRRGDWNQSLPWEGHPVKKTLTVAKRQ